MRDIFALNPAIPHCGYAHTYGRFSLPMPPPSFGQWDLMSSEKEGIRLIHLREKLVQALDQAPFQLLVFKVAHNSGVLSEFQSVIKVFCEDNEINYRGYSPSEIKKHATGKGNANKKMMVEAAVKKWSMGVNSDNIRWPLWAGVNAVWLLDLVEIEYSKLSYQSY